MKHIRTLLADLKRADTLFNLINDGDVIALGISGGKDSIVMFHALLRYQKYSKKSFKLIPIMLNLGFGRFDPKVYLNHFKKYGYNLIIEDSHSVSKILEIQKDLQNLKILPCSICSKMKKAGVNTAAIKYGANKVAFAHHIDDALETMLMNMISGGRISTFQPKMYLDRVDIMFIRPLLLTDEATIESVVRELDLPLINSGCPNDKKTRREDIKQLLLNVYDTYDGAKLNFKRMLVNDEQFNLWYSVFETELMPGVFLRKATTPHIFNDALHVRMKVFVEGQGIRVDDEFDPLEKSFSSYVLYKDTKAIGTIRYRFNKDRTADLGRLAVLAEHRNNGYATVMMQYIENKLKTKYRPVVLKLGGQAYLSDYYEKLGYEKYGEVYLDAGIEHYRFKKELK